MSCGAGNDEMYEERLRDTLPRVRRRIEVAARRVGRDPEAVRIVTVTKGHGYEAVEAALEAGLRDLGENRLEKLEEKVGRTPDGAARWHMIGHLQRRKAPRVRGVADLVHSVDSVRLAQRLNGRGTASSDDAGGAVGPAEGDAAPLRILLQVNASGEGSKSGFAPEELLDAMGRVLELPTLEVAGLMTMAPWTNDEEVLRRTFRRLRELREEASMSVPGYGGMDLSMGMSNDFEIAVEEGSTIVRLGTVLLGERSE